MAATYGSRRRRPSARGTDGRRPRRPDVAVASRLRSMRAGARLSGAGSCGRTPSAAGGRRCDRDLAPGRPLPRVRQPDHRRRRSIRCRARRRAGRRGRGHLRRDRRRLRVATTSSTCPRPCGASHAAASSGWAARADAIVTVNEALADRLAAPLAGPADPAGAQLPRAAAGAAGRRDRPDPRGARPAARIADRPVPGPARAATSGWTRPPRPSSRVPDAASSCSGSAAGASGCADATATPASPAATSRCRRVHPDELPAWTASADVAIIAAAARSR